MFTGYESLITSHGTQLKRLSRLLKPVALGDQGAGIVSGVTKAHIFSLLPFCSSHGLARRLEKESKQLNIVYLFQSVDGRHFQVTVISVHTAQ